MEFLTDFVSMTKLVLVLAVSQIAAFLLLMLITKLCGFTVSVTTHFGDDN